MEKGKKIALVSLFAFLGFTVAVLYHSITPYKTPSEIVKLEQGKNLQVIGHMEDLKKRENVAEFYLTDGKERIRVVYSGSINFISEEIVVIGDWNGTVLKAYKILRKCHTEYKGG